MDDVKIILGKKEKKQCVAITKSGERCKRKGDLDDNNLCYLHKTKE